VMWWCMSCCRQPVIFMIWNVFGLSLKPAPDAH
jgi:hypothetical protein